MHGVVAGLVLGALLLAASEPALAQPAGQTPKAGPVRSESVTTMDGWRIPITYYESTRGKETPVVLLLHGQSGSRLDWQRTPPQQQRSFAEELHQTAGYAVLAVDLRHHGEASHPTHGGGSTELTAHDYTAMAGPGGELEAVKRFIFEEHQKEKLNMARMAVIAADMSAPVAITWAFFDWSKKPHADAPSVMARTPRGQDVKALVLLSPEGNAPGLRTSAAVTGLRTASTAAFLICYGAKNAQDGREARRMFQTLSPRREDEATRRMYLQEFDVPLRGTELIGRNLGTERLILGFLDKHLRELDIPWRDRRSRLDR